MSLSEKLNVKLDCMNFSEQTVTTYMFLSKKQQNLSVTVLQKKLSMLWNKNIYFSFHNTLYYFLLWLSQGYTGYSLKSNEKHSTKKLSIYLKLNIEGQCISIYEI